MNARTCRLLAPLLGLWLLAAAPAHAAEPPLAEAEVRALMTQVAAASNARDVQGLAGTLSADCRIELRSSIGGREAVTLFDKGEYVDMLTSGYAAMKALERYDYHVAAISIELESGAATVESQVTETSVFGGRELVTQSVETARVERRDGRLVIVAVSSLTREATPPSQTAATTPQ